MYGLQDHIFDERVIEFDCGIHEGRTRKDMMHEQREVLEMAIHSSVFWRSLFGTQRPRQLVPRFQSIRYDTILVFSCFVVIRYMLSKLLRHSPDFAGQIVVKKKSLQFLSI
jgi:broad specificity phosphatase PhoE